MRLPMKQLLILLIFVTSSIIAQPRMMGRHGGDGSMMKREMRHDGMMKKLDLTSDQQKQFDKLRADMQKMRIDTHAKIQSARIDLRELFRDDKPDQGKIESKLNEIGKLQTNLKLAHTGFWFDVNKMLKPEQQKIWKDRPMMMHGMRGQEGKKIIKKRMMKMNDDDDDENDD